MRSAATELRAGVVGGWWWWWVPGKRSGGEPAQGLLPPFLPSHSWLLEKYPRSLTGPLPLSSAVCSPAPSYPGKLALGSSPISALFPHRTHSTKQHLEWGRHSGNIQSLLDIYVVFYPSFIQMLPIHHSRQWDVTMKHADSWGDHLDSNRVPPLRLCMTLSKLSRLPKLRGSILEMRETVPAPGVMMRIKPIILYHVCKT